MTEVEVIDWDQAMEQCGEDEEFLLELLGDLREELDTQISNIAQFLNGETDQPFYRIQRSAHVVKGAASNLMCEQLRLASFELEKSASSAHTSNDPTQYQKVDTNYVEFKRAQENFHAFLDQLGI